MTITYADIPKPISAGLIVLDPLRGTPLRVIGMQFNPDSLQRLVAGDALPGTCDRGCPPFATRALKRDRFLLPESPSEWRVRPPGISDPAGRRVPPSRGRRPSRRRDPDHRQVRFGELPPPRAVLLFDLQLALPRLLTSALLQGRIAIPPFPHRRWCGPGGVWRPGAGWHPTWRWDRPSGRQPPAPGARPPRLRRHGRRGHALILHDPAPARIRDTPTPRGAPEGRSGGSSPRRARWSDVGTRGICRHRWRSPAS